MFKYNQTLNNDQQFLNEKDKFLYNFSKFADVFTKAYLLEKPLEMTKLNLTDRWSPNNTIWTMTYDAGIGVNLWVHIEFTPDVIYVGDFEHREECDGHDCEEWNCGVLGEEIELKEEGELSIAEKLVLVGLSPDATREEIHAEMKKAEQDLAEAVLEFEEAPAKTCFTQCKSAGGFHVGTCKASPIAAKFSYYNQYRPHANCISENGLHVGKCVDERFKAFHTEPHANCTIKDSHHVGKCVDERYSVFYNDYQRTVEEWPGVRSASEEVIDKSKNDTIKEPENYSYFS